MNAFDYSSAKSEYVFCSLCGRNKFWVLAEKSSNRLGARSVICKICGLIYINPRMTGEEYDNYYKHFYRQDRKISKGQTDPAGEVESNFEGARKFGNALARKLSGFLKPGLTIDVGSSTGGTLYGLKEALPNLDVLGVEPSLEESAYALSKGIKTYAGLFENFTKEAGKNFSKSLPAGRQAANILCVRSLNHLLDPRAFFQWSYDSLALGAHLILYVKNFRHQVRRAGFIEAGVQIDHPYMFTPEVLRLFIESVGFKVVYLETGERTSKHILLVGEKGLGNESSVSKLSKRRYYWKIRWQFFKPYLKAYYWLFYSERLSFLRKIFLHDAFNYRSGI